MENRGEGKMENDRSWIPSTPHKPVMSNHSPIYSESQADPGFSERSFHFFSGHNNVTPCFGSTNGAEEITGGDINVDKAMKLSLDNISGLENVSFADLLALANAASVASTTAIPRWHDGSTEPFFVPIPGSVSQIQDHRMESPLTGMSSFNPQFSPGSNICNSRQEKPQCELPTTSYQHPYDLNYPPENIGNTIRQFTTITPAKIILEDHTLRTNESQNQQDSQVDTTGFSSNGVQCSTELPKSVMDSSVAVATASSVDNHHPEGGVSHDTELNKTPQQKPRRKKHRPKVIIEGKAKGTPKPVILKSTGFKENTTGKRKYVRRKGLNIDSTLLPPEASGESSGPKTLEPTKLIRRALNFEAGQPSDETVNLLSELQAENCSNKESRSVLTTQNACETEVIAENSQATPSFTADEGLKEYISMPESQAPCAPLPAHKIVSRTRKRNAHFQGGNNKKGRGDIAVQSGSEDVARIVLQPDNQLLRRSPNDNVSTSTTLNMNGQVKFSDRKDCKPGEEADTSSTNLIGIHYNSLQAYQATPWLHFPNIQRKKRTEKGHYSTASSTLSNVSAAKNIRGQETCSENDSNANPSAQKNSYWNASQSNESLVTAMLREGGQEGLKDKLQTPECIASLGQTERLTKKRSRVVTRVRDLASLSRFADCKMHSSSSDGQALAVCDRQGLESSQRSQIGIEAIVARMQSKLARKRRTRKRKSIVNRASSSAEIAHNNQKLILNGQYQHPVMSLGASPKKLWDQLFSVDAITEQLRQLDIKRDTHVLFEENNALVPYKMQNQEQKALVLYARDGTVVPFEGPFYPVQKRRPRPKVDLDDETNRVWKLLLGNINSEGIDGTDEEKTKWWEEERKVFRGRADSFIARMHLVQGDRRFSPWKGSVVDSVVGVFLTQNVSDHLSSSAFMHMAARFPLKSKINNETCHEEGSSTVTHEPVVYLVDSEDTVSDQPDCNQSSMILHDTTQNNEHDIVNSDELMCKLSNSAEGGSETLYDGEKSTVDIRQIGKISSNGDWRISNDTFSCQESAVSSQYSMDSTTSQTAERTGSCSVSNLEGDYLTKSLNCQTSFMDLLKMAGSTMLQKGHDRGVNSFSSEANSKDEHAQVETVDHGNERLYVNDLNGTKSVSKEPIVPSTNLSSYYTSSPNLMEVESFEVFREEVGFCKISKDKDEYTIAVQNPLTREVMTQTTDQNKMNLAVREELRCSSTINETSKRVQEDNISQSQTEMFGAPTTTVEQQNLADDKEPHDHIDILDVTESSNTLHSKNIIQQKTPQSDLNEQGSSCSKELKEMNGTSLKSKSRKIIKEKNIDFDWDSLRREVEPGGIKRERTANTMDSVDWEAVRCANVSDIADTIKERGMNNMLAERIQDFLNRLVREHGSIDLEWLRDIPPDKTKEFLLSIRGIGLKSVECVRLLTLHHLAFPVDTNVGRIAVRLGWVPLQPLPESLQLHLLEMYPILESIQKYLWPRLCKLDQRTLYELHYQMITFGKVFCTKSKPNCNSCPMRGECRHFASAFASARLALPGPEEKSIVSANENRKCDQNPSRGINPLPIPLLESGALDGKEISEVKLDLQEKSGVHLNEPIIEVPATPEREYPQELDADIEDAFFEDPDEIPTIKLNMEEFTQNLQNYMQHNMELQDGEMSKALVALSPEAASIPTQKLKNMSRLRTEHQVYELPDSHPLLKQLDKREPDDPCSYLLAIWTPGESADSVQPPERSCSSQEYGTLCDEKTCFSCNSIREADSQIVRGTLLVPCRTANRGRFPLNGTYFQVNEVFADHDSSLNPIEVPRHWIWNLPRRTVYFGTSIPTIFKGLTTEGIQHCFWKGFVCVRGFDQKTRAPRPLMARLHFPASKLNKAKGKTDADDK